MKVTKQDNTLQDIDIAKIRNAAEYSCEGLDGCDPSQIEMGAQIQFYDGIKTIEIQKALIKSAQRLISEKTPNYSKAAARLLLMTLYKTAGCKKDGEVAYLPFNEYLLRAAQEGRIDGRLMTQFDLGRIEEALDLKRDLDFGLLGLQTLERSYLLRRRANGKELGEVIEMPQQFWMRVAMGLSLNYPTTEIRTEKAIRFYKEAYSQMNFISSTPTLYNSGTLYSQMSSCYGNTVEDNLVDRYGIFHKIEECARLSKFAGGIGTDWHKVRGEGGAIESTNGESSGIVPFLKIYNATSVAVNQGGKRKGAFAPYIEPWHADAMDFMTLKKNAGEERRRCHDIFPAWWANDLLFKRVNEGGQWSFFDPKDVPRMHELYGDKFEAAYIEAEKAGLAKDTIEAAEFWRKLILSLMDTGAPWITFKDQHNRRNPQQHDGVIHNTNLCTEISLNNKPDETFVCNLGSLNLSKFVVNGKFDFDKLADAVHLAVEMLDNVIDLNYYPSEESRNSNLRHRPIGLGVMGYAEALNMCGIDYESQAHLDWANELFQMISYHAIWASCNLAKERGAYDSFSGSLWSQGILTPHTAPQEATGLVTGDYMATEMWDALADEVAKHGIRNCNLLAIAPTATIANIAGTTACTELSTMPSYSKANLGGTFKVFDPAMLHNPELAKFAYDIDQKWTILPAAVRQIWIDQAQSTNLFRKAGTNGRTVAEWYMLAWQYGLKSTYYLKNQKKTAAKAGEVK